MERTTMAFIVGVAVMLFAFFSIIGSDPPASVDSESDVGAPVESVVDTGDANTQAQ